MCLLMIFAHGKEVKQMQDKSILLVLLLNKVATHRTLWKREETRRFFYCLQRSFTGIYVGVYVTQSLKAILSFKIC